MSQAEILDAIRALSPDERIDLIATVLQMTRDDLRAGKPALTIREQMIAAAAFMRDAYEHDGELTSFTAIDGDDFDAAR
jgi:hypothetical protein